ncbi:MAG TPA: ABC transporter permease [Pyrinomonadaceae bacterium]|jgi:predicted permease|nr:ABC transporter permease [Pyrinomonadaceae bacterium]
MLNAKRKGPWLWLITLVGVIVPRRLRADWRQEWESELRYRETLLAKWDQLNWRTKLDLLWHSAGAFVDALWLQPRRWEDAMIQDLRFGVRMLLKHKGFTVVAILSLALGIGANTAIFQLLDAVRLRTLPVKAPHELVEVRIADMKAARGGIWREPSVTFPIWEQIRDRQQAFSGIFAWGTDTSNLAPGGEVRPARMLYVSGDFFNTLGVNATRGRVFNSADDQRGCAAPGVIVSHQFWQREYGGDANVVGRSLALADHSFEIVGVTPQNFFGMEVGKSFDLAMPICAASIVRGNTRMFSGIMWWLTVNGRLKPGWTLDQAAAHTQTISADLFQAALPPDYPQPSVNDYLQSKLLALPAGAGVSELREKYEQSLWLLLAIAGLVLLIACANLANLLLARASAREREIAVRQTLGASRGRLIRQLLVESLLLALIGASLGAALAQALSRAMLAFLSTANDPVFIDLAPDWRVLGFTAGLAIVTCVLFGLTPAIRVTRRKAGAVLKAAGRGLTANRERFTLRRGLAVAQVALSLVLVTAALLFSRSLDKILTLEIGFRHEDVLTATATFRKLNLPPERIPGFRDELLERVRTVPGVESAAISNVTPLRGWGGGTAWMDSKGARQTAHTSLSRVGPDYFKTLEIPLLAGRDFDTRDRQDTPLVAIVNQAFTRKFASGANPVGQRLWIEASPGSPDTPYEIVGLVGDTKYEDLREPFQPIVYYAEAQDDSGPGAQLLIRSRLPQGETVAAVKRVLNEIHPAITVSFEGLTPIIESTILRERLMATLSGFFGLLALVLACIGLYGILSYGVASRTTELGIRMALGAQRGDVFWLILREALWLVLIGMAVGLPLIFVVTRLAASLLFDLSPTDPVSLSAAALLLFGVAMLAGYLPSRRATRVDPIVALRYE